MSWVLFDFGRRSAALRNAQQLLLAANASQDATLQNTFALAAQAYYDALAAQRSLAASRQVAELAAQNLEAADAKYRAGAAALPIACRRRPRCPRRASPRSATKAP